MYTSQIHYRRVWVINASAYRRIGGQYNASADVLGRAAGKAPAGWLIAGRVISGALYTATPATDQLPASQA